VGEMRDKQMEWVRRGKGVKDIKVQKERKKEGRDIDIKVNNLSPRD
jgi:hypothetical protein